MRNVISILILIAGFVAGMTIATALFSWVVLSKLTGIFSPATAENSRTEMVVENADAMILMSFVTGDVPRLLRGPALDKWSGNLWYTNNADAGTVVGAVLFGLMGMPLFEDIGTAFEAGVPVESFSCVTAGCITWPAGETDMWGLLPLRGLGAALGPEVYLEHATFTDYESYREAHAEVSRDPLRWFAYPHNHVLQPDTDGKRQVVISLPIRLMTISPTTRMSEQNSALAEELKVFASKLIEGIDGSIKSVRGTDNMPLWVTKDEDYLRDPDGSLLALPQLAATNPTLVLNVDASAVPIVRERLRIAAVPPADLSAIPSAVASAYIQWGIDTDCLPGCGGATPSAFVNETAEMSVSAKPFWSLSYWRIPPE